MQTDSLILPCLREQEWARRGVSAGRLLWDARRSAYIPWVGFGYDGSHAFEFLPRAAPEQMGKSLDRIEREAVRNLRLRNAVWRPHDVKLGWFQSIRMLICEGDFFAAEKILEPAFMRQAETALTARGLLAGIPRRGFLAVTSGEQGPKKIQVFAAMVSMQYHRMESVPISPAVFAVKDGAIVGMIEAAVDTGRSAAPSEDEDAGEVVEEDPGEPYVNAAAVRNPQGEYELEISAAGRDADRLAKRVEGGIGFGLTKHGRLPEFNGAVRIVILAHTPQLVRKELYRWQGRLEGMAKAVGSGMAPGKEIRISITEQAGSSPVAPRTGSGSSTS